MVIIFLSAPYVLLQSWVLIAFSMLMHSFLPFKSLSGANEVRDKSVLICQSSCPLASLRGKVKTWRLNVSKMKKEEKDREEKRGAEREREKSRIIHPSPHLKSCRFNPVIHPFRFSQTCWLTALMQCKLFFKSFGKGPSSYFWGLFSAHFTRLHKFMLSTPF